MCPAIHIHHLMAGQSLGEAGSPLFYMPTLRLHEVRAFPGGPQAGGSMSVVKRGRPAWPSRQKRQDGVARPCSSERGHSPRFPTGAHTLLLSE